MNRIEEWTADHSAPRLTRLVYELLDAHDDTARLAAEDPLDERWRAHLAYLRDLQRVAREELAHCTPAPAPAPHSTEQHTR